MKELRKEMREGFSKIDFKFEKIDVKFDNIDVKFDKINKVLIGTLFTGSIFPAGKFL